MTEEYLLEAGHEVVTTRTGDEALAAFRYPDPRPDALVVDNRLPDMLGWDVAERCRAIAPDLPVIICSGDTQTGARDLPGVVLLGKPYTEQQLNAALAEACRRT